MDFHRKLEINNIFIKDGNRLIRYLEEKSQYRYNHILFKIILYQKQLTDSHLHDFYRYDIRLRRL